MAKDNYRECPDCSGPDVSMSTLFGGKGDGRCSECRGEGRQTDVVRSLAGPILGFDTDEACRKCNGTGQCQTCGGTGYEYYSEQESGEGANTVNDNSYSGYSGSYESSYDTTSPGPATESDVGSWQFVGVVFIIMVIIGLFCYNYFSNNHPPKKSPQHYSQEKPVYRVLEKCETEITGNYSFTNKMNRTIFLFISAHTGFFTKTLKIGPHETVTEYDLRAFRHACNFDFQCSYFKDGLYNKSDISGSFIVEQCITKTLKLELPEAYWYKLKYDIWKEITLPVGCCYVIVMPFKNFLFRFSQEDKEQYGRSLLYIPEGASKVYIKYNATNNDEEVSIHKYTPRI